MRVFGFEASVERFLRTSGIPGVDQGRILDNGCGSGTLGIHFLQASKQSTLLSTDLEPNFLEAATRKAQRRGIAQEQMTVGIANISDPDHVRTESDSTLHLQPETFQLICLGAVLGYAKDPEKSLRCLAGLLTPGGYLLNLEMCETRLGQYVSKRYHYSNISIQRMTEIMSEEGCDVRHLKMGIQHFPACMTRTALIAEKK